MLSHNQRTIVDIRIYIFSRIRSTAKTKLHYVADIMLDKGFTVFVSEEAIK